MLGSVALEVAIGLVFVFLIVSIIGSGITEFIANHLKSLRSDNLEQAIRHILSDDVDKGEDATAARFFKHALFAGLKGPKKDAVSGRRGKSQRFPSYMPSNRFALTVMDMLDSGGTLDSDGNRSYVIANLAEAAAGLPEGSAKTAILAQIALAENDLEKFRDGLATWFDETMDRASGWYKRRIQKFVFFSSFFVAAVLNADAIMIAERLSTDRELLKATVALAEEVVKSGNIEEAKELDYSAMAEKAERQELLGWTTTTGDSRAFPWKQENVGQAYAVKAIGLLITTLAAMLGAPFWFDLLNKLINLRSGGKAEKTDRKGKDAQQRKPSGT